MQQKVIFSQDGVNGRFRGFTLIELLVVIAIISLLAAILFPVFARARENARRSSCMSNLKQMDLGIMQYIQDNNGNFPPFVMRGQTAPPPDGIIWESSLPTYWYWPQLIYPYVRTSQIYVCPDAPAGYQFSPNAPDFGNYGANKLVMNDPQSNPVRWPMVGESAIASPATTYLIMDGGLIDLNPADVALNTATVITYIPGTGPGSGANLPQIPTSHSDLKADFSTGRHFNGINVGFADGHVKWLKSETVLNEAKKCPSTSDFGNPQVLPTQKSAWNPFVDNS